MSRDFKVILFVSLNGVSVFSSVCRPKAKIMFEVEEEMQGRINIYEANLSVFFLV